MERSFGQLLSVHEGSYLSFDKDKPLASSLNAGAWPVPYAKFQKVLR